MIRPIDPQTRAWAVVAAASIARLAIGFVASVTVARALGVADFGVYALLGAVAGLAGVLGDPGLTQSGVKRIASVWPDDPVAARRRAGAFLWLRIGAALPVVVVGIALGEPIARLALAHPRIGGLVALTFLGVGATAASGGVSTILQATGRFGQLSAVLLANSALTALLALALAATGTLTLVTAVLVLGIGTSLASVGLGWRLLPWSGVPWPTATMELRDEGAALLRFGRWLWLADVLAMAGTQLDVLLVNFWSPLATVGAYALALNLATKADVVNHGLYTVLLPSAASLRDAGARRGYVRRALRRSALIAVAALPLFPLAGPLIALFYGPSFAGAAGLFQLLLAVVLFDVFATPLTLLAFADDRPGLIAAADALRVAVLAAAGVLLIPALGPLGAVIARGASRVAGAALVLVALRLGKQSVFQR